MQAQRWVDTARANLARVIGASGGRDIAICNSGTHALNAALWGLLRPGDHVITTAMDHNSLLRPLDYLTKTARIEISIVPTDDRACTDARAAQAFVRDNTKLFAVGHASNVTGWVQDIAAWSAVAHGCGAQLLLDASQSLGYLSLDVQALGVDILAAAGHKGLRALSGTGMLYVREALQAEMRPLMFGGTGRDSEQLAGGQVWPQSVEVGNLNLPGIVSLAVGAAELLPSGHSDAWLANYQFLVEGLAELPDVSLIGFEQSLDCSRHVPVVSLTVEGWDVHDLAAVLDSSFGIEARAGWHCAAMVHASLGTASGGGTLRLSPGVSTTRDDIEYTLDAFRQILGSGR